MPSWEVSSKKPFGKSKRELEKVGIAIFTSLVEDNCSKSQRNQRQHFPFTASTWIEFDFEVLAFQDGITVVWAIW